MKKSSPPQGDIIDIRDDMTHYVVHLTKGREGTNGATPFQVLLEILHTGFICPSFARMPNQWQDTPRNTILGPHPAVCFTDQPITTLLQTIQHFRGCRYSGYGVAYRKDRLYRHGGRPVIYGDDTILGRKLKKGDGGWEEGKEIYTGGLSADLQYRYVRYNPTRDGGSPLDHTWEREWRVKVATPVLLKGHDFVDTVYSTIVVEKDVDSDAVMSSLKRLSVPGDFPVKVVHRVVSLETAKRRLDEGDKRYGKIETYLVAEGHVA